jgi:small subunit ribosomal protein S21
MVIQRSRLMVSPCCQLPSVLLFNVSWMAVTRCWLFKTSSTVRHTPLCDMLWSTRNSGEMGLLIQKLVLVPEGKTASTRPVDSMIPVNIFAKFDFLGRCFHISENPAIFASLKCTKGGIQVMLIIDSKDCENIDKALKKYKKKFEKAKILLQLRERQSYTKPSVRRRNTVLKAVYKQKVSTGQIES